MTRSLTAVAVAVVVLLASAAPASAHGRLYLTSKTPYAPQESIRDYQPAPYGFVPVFTENVARHGSRAMSDGDDGTAVLAVLTDAASRDALTGLGARLGPQVQTLLAGAATIGYGQLAGRGVREQHDTARRMERRLPGLFRTIVARQEPITVGSSGVKRATDSANAFTGGLIAGDPRLAGLIQAPVAEPDLLYFHKQPQNADYQDYLDNDPQLKATLAAIDGQPRTAASATHVLSRLFSPAYVAAMPAAARVDFVTSLYALYSSASDLSVEAPGVELTPFLPAADARWFAYLDDAEAFYQSGPGFAGRTITYAMARVLLDDMLAQAQAKADGTSTTGAVLRFTHAEEIQPLAVLLGLPGSTQPADPAHPYTYAGNPFRGETVAPMAANIQWDLFSDGHRYLVRELYNEKETAFPARCRPIRRHSVFYDLRELSACLAG
jgi:hypothetical protein